MVNSILLDSMIVDISTKIDGHAIGMALVNACFFVLPLVSSSKIRQSKSPTPIKGMKRLGFVHSLLSGEHGCIEIIDDFQSSGSFYEMRAEGNSHPGFSLGNHL